jgi:hypothetical protein
LLSPLPSPLPSPLALGLGLALPRMRLLLIIFTFIFAGAKYDYEPENAISCSDIHDSKEANQCRKNHAGGLQCRDKTRCTLESGDLNTMHVIDPLSGHELDVFYCSNDGASYRTGHQCNDYPYYMGGYPMGPIYWDDEWETYDCVRNSSSYCNEWESFEYSPIEYELGIFTCQKTAISSLNHTYCLEFTSVQRETKYCDSETSSCSPNCNRPTFCNKLCCSDNGCYDCSYVPHTEYEYSLATVLAVNEYGAWLQWTQQEYDGFNLKFREYENYNCTVLSGNKRYCHSWIGDIDSEEEFEIASCTCIDEPDNLSSFCKKWRCYETGMAYFFPSLPWVVMGLFLYLLTLLFLPTFLHAETELTIWFHICILHSILPVSLSVAVIYLGGLPAWTLWFCLHVLIMLLILSCKCYSRAEPVDHASNFDLVTLAVDVEAVELEVVPSTDRLRGEEKRSKEEQNRLIAEKERQRREDEGRKQVAIEVPDEFICPMTLDVMLDPVSCSDGHTYEHKEIEKWFSLGNITSPKTGVQLSDLNLVPNRNLRQAIERFKDLQR